MIMKSACHTRCADSPSFNAQCTRHCVGAGRWCRPLVQASLLPPIVGEVVLQDLVISDNRAWYDRGEAGVRIKVEFAGRSMRVER